MRKTNVFHLKYFLIWRRFCQGFLRLFFISGCCVSFQVYADLPNLSLSELPKFNTLDLFEQVKEGILNTNGFVSGTCTGEIIVPIPPFVHPFVVNHITHHQPDLLVTAYSQPFKSPWQDPVGEAKRKLFQKVIAEGLLYRRALKKAGLKHMGGGVVNTSGGGQSPARFKDVEIFGNPAWPAYALYAREAFPQMMFGCLPQFLPYVPVYSSEIDFFWRPNPIGGILSALTGFVPRTVGSFNMPLPTGVPILGKLLNFAMSLTGSNPVMSPFFPLEGGVNNPTKSFVAAVAAIRAAYIATTPGAVISLDAGLFEQGSALDKVKAIGSTIASNWGLFQHPLFTGHYPQHPGTVLGGCLSKECKTFPSEEYSKGKDKSGLWQMVSPFPMPIALPLDTMENQYFLKVVDTITNSFNREEEYGFLHWRCYKCCDLPNLNNIFVNLKVETLTQGMPPEPIGWLTKTGYMLKKVGGIASDLSSGKIDLDTMMNAKDLYQTVNLAKKMKEAADEADKAQKEIEEGKPESEKTEAEKKQAEEIKKSKELIEEQERLRKEKEAEEQALKTPEELDQDKQKQMEEERERERKIQEYKEQQQKQLEENLNKSGSEAVPGGPLTEEEIKAEKEEAEKESLYRELEGEKFKKDFKEQKPMPQEKYDEEELKKLQEAILKAREAEKNKEPDQVTAPQPMEEDPEAIKLRNLLLEEQKKKEAAGN